MSFCLCLVVVGLQAGKRMPIEWGNLLQGICRIYGLRGTGRLGQEKRMDLLHSSPLAQRNELGLFFVASCKDLSWALRVLQPFSQPDVSLDVVSSVGLHIPCPFQPCPFLICYHQCEIHRSASPQKRRQPRANTSRVCQEHWRQNSTTQDGESQIYSYLQNITELIQSII